MDDLPSSNQSLEEKVEKLKKELKQTEEELKAVRSLFNGIGDAIIYIDENKRIVRINEAVTRIAGYAEKDLVGKKFTALAGIVAPESIPTALKAFTKRLMGIETPPYEIKVKAKDGRKIDVEVVGAAIKKKGKRVGTVAVLRDITQRKKTQKALKERTQQLEKINRLMRGREIKMIELKKKIKQLKQKLAQKST